MERVVEIAARSYEYRKSARSIRCVRHCTRLTGNPSPIGVTEGLRRNQMGGSLGPANPAIGGTHSEVNNWTRKQPMVGFRSGVCPASQKNIPTYSSL